MIDRIMDEEGIVRTFGEFGRTEREMSFQTFAHELRDIEIRVLKV